VKGVKPGKLNIQLNEQLHGAFGPARNLFYRTNNSLIENFQANNLNELMADTNGVLFRLRRLLDSKQTHLLGVSSRMSLMIAVSIGG
jgi:hypothetical protein